MVMIMMRVAAFFLFVSVMVVVQSSFTPVEAFSTVTTTSCGTRGSININSGLGERKRRTTEATAAASVVTPGVVLSASRTSPGGNSNSIYGSGRFVVYKTESRTESKKENNNNAEETKSTSASNTKQDNDVQSSTDPSSSSSSSLPPVIQQIADERRLYQMNVGKAMDVLRKDMQNIFTQQPDYSIYTDDVSLVDPSGVQLTGLDKYKSAIRFFQTFLGFWFRTEKSVASTRSTTSGIQFRMVYDFARSSIRISWNAVLVPKVSGFGMMNVMMKPMYVDGISYYQLDRASGLIQEHKIEKLMINNTPVIPPYAIWSLLQQDALRGLSSAQRGGAGIGVAASVSGTLSTTPTNTLQ